MRSGKTEALRRRKLTGLELGAVGLRRRPVVLIAGGWLPAGGGAGPAEGADAAGHDGHLPVGQGPGPVELVRDQEHGAPVGGGAQQVVEQVAAGGVEAGVGLVEQQEPGPAGQRDGQARPALLARRQPPEGHAGQAGEAELLEDGVGVGRRPAAGPDPEAHVLPHGQVVVGAGGMADQGQLGPDGMAVGARSWPRTTAVPADSGRSPANSRRSVVLPAPLGPATSTTSPSATSRSTPASAG